MSQFKLHNLDTIRRVLRLMSYYFYSRNTSTKFGINPRTHDTALKVIRNIFPPEFQVDKQEQFIKKLQYNPEFTNRYNTSFNYLQKIFQYKIPNPETVLDFLLILSAFDKDHNDFTFIELKKFLWDPRPYEPNHYPHYKTPLELKRIKDTLNEPALRVRIDRLVSIGILQEKTNNNGVRIYHLPHYPLPDLTDEDLLSLQDALKFYRNVCILSAPGYTLVDKIRTILPSTKDSNDYPIVFQNNNATRILDNAILSDAIKAINLHELLHFTYDGTEEDIKVIPHHIISDPLYNREYIIGQRVDYNDKTDTFKINPAEPFKVQKMNRVYVKSIPLPLISYVTAHKNTDFNISGTLYPLNKHASPTQELVFKLIFDPLYKKSDLIIKIKEACRGQSLTLLESSDSYQIYKLKSFDLLKILPNLRICMPHIKLLETNTSIAKKITDDLHKTLNNYLLNSVPNTISDVTKNKSNPQTASSRVKSEDSSTNLKERGYWNTIFNELNSSIMFTLMELIRQVDSGEDIDKESIINTLASITNVSTAKKFTNFFFRFDLQTPRSILPNPLPDFLFGDEAGFLKQLVEDCNFNWLISEDLKKELQTACKEFQLLIKSTHYSTLPPIETALTTSNQNNLLTTILQSFKLKNNISIQLKSENLIGFSSINNNPLALPKQIEVSPCRLEYNLATHQYALLVYNKEQYTFAGIPLSAIEKITISNPSVPINLDTIFANYIEKNSHTITFILHDSTTRNTFDRCFGIFSPHLIDASQLNINQNQGSENPKYKLTISFCTFDEIQTTMFDKLLSLGSAVEIIEPISLRKHMIDILQKSLTLCSRI